MGSAEAHRRHRNGLTVLRAGGGCGYIEPVQRREPHRRRLQRHATLCPQRRGGHCTCQRWPSDSESGRSGESDASGADESSRAATPPAVVATAAAAAPPPPPPPPLSPGSPGSPASPPTEATPPAVAGTPLHMRHPRQQRRRRVSAAAAQAASAEGAEAEATAAATTSHPVELNVFFPMLSLGLEPANAMLAQPSASSTQLVLGSPEGLFIVR